VDELSRNFVEEARHLLDRGNREKARRLLGHAVRHAPYEAEIWYWLARALDERDQIEEALRRALRYDPELQEAQAYLNDLQADEEEPELDLRWLLDDEDAPAPAGDPEVQPEAGTLQEQQTREQPLAGLHDEWSLLDELEQLSAEPAGQEVLAETPLPTEEELWDRALALFKKASTLLAEGPPPARTVQPEDGVTLGEETVASGTAHDPAAATPVPARPRPGSIRLMARMIGLMLALAALGVAGWFVLQNAHELLPARLLEANPALATTIVEAQIRTAPRPTPLPAPAWVQQAQTARYDNRPEQAEALLLQGLADDPQNVRALAMLSDMYRELPGGEEAALAIAQQALDSVRTLPQRALAAEAFAWAILVQPEPEEELAMARAEQAVAETPRSPHSYWALAAAAALEGEAASADDAMTLAAQLSPRWESAVTLARQGELLTRLGQLDRAV
jgi:hypothetical protein